MSTGLGPTDAVARASHATVHRPAVAAVIAFSVGICLDRALTLPMTFWLSIAGLGLCLSIWANRRTTSQHDKVLTYARLASTFCLLTFMAVGGVRQHLDWNMRPSNDIATFSSHSPRPVRLKGIVSTPVEITESPFGPHIPAWMEVDHSTCQLQCELLETPEGWQTVSGLVRMDVSGHLTHVRVGDQIEVLGHLSQPSPVQNPGSLDYGNFLKQQGISSIIRVEHPVAVTKLQNLSSLRWSLARCRELMRESCQQIFLKNLPPQQQGVASSLLLGDRSMLTDELRDQFAQSGTIHLLAISGLHVAILLGLVLAGCRLVNLSPRVMTATLLITILAYAFLTDHRPPVLRAGLLATLALLGMSRGKRIDRMNLLAMCALLLLIWHPADLFDIGAQLSFLAVGALLWSASWNLRENQSEPDAPDLSPETTIWTQRLQSIGMYFLQVYIMTSAIWLTTLPLTMSTFHLVAPVGIFLNVLLIPYIAVVLSLGYLLMFGGLLLPITAGVLAIPFQWSLSVLLQIVEWGQNAPLGHFSVAQIPMWWLVVFYLLLACAWGLIGTQRTSRWGLRAVLCWSILGLLLPLLPQHRDSLRCTFLSVGHGLASVMEFPSGETFLYDAGTIGDGERAARVVRNALWSRGIHKLDAVIVSHADHDHYSGLFSLLKLFPVDTLLIHQSFLSFEQSSVEELCELAVSQGVSIRLLQAGDQLSLRNDRSASTQIDVLYPPSGISQRSDNAASLVLSLEYAGRRILLTGDLEKEGLQDVLALPAREVEILLSPHHGGKVARVLELYDWAQPRYAIVSSSSESLPHLKEIPNNCKLLNTATSGAVTFQIFPDGTTQVEEFRE